MKNVFVASLVSLTLACGSAARAADVAKLDGRINAAHAVLHQLMNTPDKGVPLDIAAKARCVVVVPSFKKGAFIVGGEYGQGVATCRTARGWSAPVFVQMAGASFGFQAGGESTDLVLVGVTKKSLIDLLKDKIKLGGDIAAAAGPVGRDSQASTTELANAEFFTYSRSKGLFAGVDLNGDEVNQNSKDTTAYYGRNISYHTILNGGVRTPVSARHFISTVNEMFRAGRTHEAKEK